MIQAPNPQDALGQRSSGGGAVVDVEELLSVSEIRFEPGEGSASDVEGTFKAGEKNGVVDGFKSCSEIQEDEDAELARVCREEEDVSYFKEGCFCAVLGTEARFKRFKEVSGDEMGFELSGNIAFQYF